MWPFIVRPTTQTVANSLDMHNINISNNNCNHNNHMVFGITIATIFRRNCIMVSTMQQLEHQRHHRLNSCLSISSELMSALEYR